MIGADGALVTYITEPEGALDPLVQRLRRLGDLAATVRARVAVQVRRPHATGAALLASAELLREATAELGMKLIVNDRLDVAMLADADGVHLGGRSIGVADARRVVGERIVTVACHTVDDVRRAASEGADAALLSPVYETPGKGSPTGLGTIERASQALPPGSRLGVIALGGITSERAGACIRAGAAGVAAIRADLEAFLRSQAARSVVSAS